MYRNTMDMQDVPIQIISSRKINTGAQTLHKREIVASYFNLASI